MKLFRRPAGASAAKLSAINVLLSILVLLALIGGASSYYFYGKYNALRENPEAEAQRQTDRIVAEVGMLMQLPGDESPTVAVISDKEKLIDQPFFDEADNGDILLAYTTAMKAVLYRPATKKIINVAPITLGESVPTTDTFTETAADEESVDTSNE